MERNVRALIDGGIGGAIGTLVMSAVMLAARRLGLVGKLPPERIVEAGLDAVGKRRSGSAQDALAALAHFLFGASLGALFGLLYQRLALPPSGKPGQAPGPGAALPGGAYGLVVWAVNYKGWIPALGILPPPEHDRPDRPVVVALAHVVYGAALGAVVGRRAGAAGQVR